MAVIIIIAILTIGLILIATENINKMNKSAVAMFIGVLCWLLYIGHGKTFVVSEHQIDFLSFLSNHPPNSHSVKFFISSAIFSKYIISAAEIVLFLIGTMSIVEVLNNNGCFDFMQEWLRTRNPRRFLWIVTGLTFVISANLDNLTTVCLMLAIMHAMVADDRLRMTFGAVIVLAANCGGAFTVIGDVTSLTLWTKGLITPTTYAATLVLPCIVALTTTVLLVSMQLPHRLNLVQSAPPYRGDDTLLTRPQRLLLLLVGFGGLWFIPTFHRITLMPPFVGALCVLALLWIVNEICNRSLLGSDQMTRKRQPMALQYANIQHILFFIGMTLAFGAVNETGILNKIFDWSVSCLGNAYYISSTMGLLASIFNNITVVLANLSVFSQDMLPTHPELIETLGSNTIFWPLLSYSTALGGSLFSTGTLAGFAFMRMEGATLKWYIRNFTGKILIGWIAGLGVFYITATFI